MSLFSFKDYKDFLKSKAQESRGNLTLLAKAAGCQPSYLLRVIHEEAELTLDQTYRLSEYWHFDSSEQEFFMTQVNYSRAADKNYKASLKKKMEELLQAHNNLSKIVERPQVTEIQSLVEYHSDPRIALAHFLTDCRGYQTKERLAERLRLSLSEVDDLLHFLSKLNLISLEGKMIKFKTGVVHIPRNSPVLSIFLNNWRQMAVQKSLKTKEPSVHFTNIQTISKADLQKLIELANQFIQKAKNQCDQSGYEEVAVINVDVFIP